MASAGVPFVLRGAPSDLVLDFRRVSVKNAGIPGPCFGHLDWDGAAGHLLSDLGDLEYRVWLPVAHVVVQQVVVSEREHELHVRINEVGNVDIVALG